MNEIELMFVIIGNKHATIIIKSLENSIQEITVMADQIRINHQLMPPDLAATLR